MPEGSIIMMPEGSVRRLPDVQTGAICETEKLGKRVTASVCVSRLSGEDPVLILTPCGSCQERLFHWGLTSKLPSTIPQTRPGGRRRP
jgi:cytidine deaminase